MKYLNIVWFLVLVLIAYSVTLIRSHYYEQLRAEYPSLQRQDNVNDSVQELIVTKGVMFVGIKGRKFRFTESQCFSHPRVSGSQIISIGDSIVKGYGSDSLTIVHESVEYGFIIRVDDE